MFQSSQQFMQRHLLRAMTNRERKSNILASLYLNKCEEKRTYTEQERSFVVEDDEESSDLVGFQQCMNAGSQISLFLLLGKGTLAPSAYSSQHQQQQHLSNQSLSLHRHYLRMCFYHLLSHPFIQRLSQYLSNVVSVLRQGLQLLRYWQGLRKTQTAIPTFITSSKQS